MKKVLNRILIGALTLTMVLGLAACGAPVTLASKTTNGITMDVPSDLSEFADQNGSQLAADKNKTGVVIISPVAASQGLQAEGLDEAAFQAQMMPGVENVEFLKYDNAYDCDGVPAVFASCKYANTSGVTVVNNVLILFFEDDTIQTIVVTYSDGSDSSVKTNIDAILGSVKVEG